jgi:hypothetical protein
MKKHENIKVNGKPLEEHIEKIESEEIAEVRKTENNFRVNPPRVTRSNGNHSGERSGPVRGLENIDPKTTHVMICGTLFPPLAKAPFTTSGKSLLGAMEYCETDGTVKCHEGGEWLKAVGMHIRTHDISAHTYKVKHGLRQSSALQFAKTTRRKLPQAFTANNDPRRKAASIARWREGTVSVSRSITELANLRNRCRAQVVDRIRTLAANLNRTPTISEIQASGISHEIIYRYFGCIRQAMRSSGLAAYIRCPNYRLTPEQRERKRLNCRKAALAVWAKRRGEANPHVS